MNSQVRNIDLYFSADCNLNCKYCYIYKHKEKLQSYNEDIIYKIKNGEYIKNLKEKCGEYIDNIISVGLWGAEPTLNTSAAQIFIPELFNTFKNIEKLFFSTNAVLGFKSIQPFIDIIREYNINNLDRKIKLEIQFSIDGPEWITDRTRNLTGITNQILKTIDDTINYLKELDNISIEIKVKPTLDMDIINTLNKDINKIIEWFCFFDNLFEKYKHLDNEDFELNLLGYPTIVNPDIYTIEDGKQYALFVKNLSSLDISYFKNYSHPLILQPISGFRKDIMNKDLDLQKGYGACSAGNGSLSFDKDGNIHSCHRFFNYMPCPEEGLDVIQSYYKVSSDVDIAKLNLLNYSYHNNFYCRFEYFKIIANTLARYNQIDKIYLQNNENLLLLFCSIESIMCHYGQAEETKDPLIAQTGYIKLLGNGALQELIKYMKGNREL